jgi:hypothetical protein
MFFPILAIMLAFALAPAHPVQPEPTSYICYSGACA